MNTSRPGMIRDIEILRAPLPAMFFIRETAFRMDINVNRHKFSIVVLAFVLIFILAEINYRLVETPARLQGKKIAARIGRQN